MQTSITSERLFINPLTTNDSKFIFELVNTDGWLKYIGDRDIHSLEDALSYINKVISNPKINYWTVRLKHYDTPIGIISLVKRDYLTYPDIGFAFLPSFASNGYAYEAAKATLRHLISTTDHTYIHGVTIHENIPSIKLLIKLGLTFQNDVEIENEKLQVYEVSADKLHISEITESFFRVFSNKNGSQANLDMLNTICIPQVLIINKKNPETNIFDLASFTEPRKKILSDGTLIEFEEKEIYEETKVFSNIAHRYSEYEKRGVLNGKQFKQKGHKFFQFVKIEKSWKINSVIWEDDEN